MITTTNKKKHSVEWREASNAISEFINTGTVELDRAISVIDRYLAKFLGDTYAQEKFLRTLNHFVKISPNENATLPPDFTNDYSALDYVITQRRKLIKSKNQEGISDGFSKEELERLHTKIDEIIQKLDRSDSGQQVLYEELQELKSVTNLTKKNWYQLAFGKIGEAVFGYGLQEILGKEVMRTLQESGGEIIRTLSQG